MRRVGLADIHDPVMPADVYLRRASHGDEAALARLLSEAFGTCWRLDDVAARLTRAADVDAVFVAFRDSFLVATASARLDPVAFPHEGYVHWVATAPSERGRGLGRAVTMAVLRRFKDIGLPSAVLETDDERLDAIGMYLGLGFQPVLRDSGDTERWDRILQAIGNHERKV